MIAILGIALLGMLVMQSTGPHDNSAQKPAATAAEEPSGDRPVRELSRGGAVFPRRQARPRDAGSYSGGRSLWFARRDSHGPGQSAPKPDRVVKKPAAPPAAAGPQSADLCFRFARRSGRA